MMSVGDWSFDVTLEVDLKCSFWSSVHRRLVLKGS